MVEEEEEEEERDEREWEDGKSCGRGETLRKRSEEEAEDEKEEAVERRETGI